MNQESGIKNHGVVLAIRTDAPDAIISLWNNGQEIESYTWLAGRQLSTSLLSKTLELLHRHKLDWKDLTGLIVFKGPGSFTGLRIGITVANAMAYSLNVPIVGTTGDDWVEQGIKLLPQTKAGQWVAPEYGAEANISKPKR